jgi:hypothetical protein
MKIPVTDVKSGMNGLEAGQIGTERIRICGGCSTAYWGYHSCPRCGTSEGIWLSRIIGKVGVINVGEQLELNLPAGRVRA